LNTGVEIDKKFPDLKDKFVRVTSEIEHDSETAGA
jgi:hypothetical protein